MKTAIGVVELSVSNLSTISLHVDGIHVHGVRIDIENCWLIHVIPEGVEMVRSNKVVKLEELSPIVLSIFIQEVDPSRVARPAVSIVRVGAARACSHKCIGDVTFWLFLILILHSIVVDEVVISNLDMWINDDSDSASSILDLFVHLLDLVLSEVLLIEDEVSVVALDAVLHGPLNIRPEYVNWETIASEVSISIHQHLC